jgi:hypothetical protein
LVEHGFTQTFQLGAAEFNSEPSKMGNAEKVTGDKALLSRAGLSATFPLSQSQGFSLSIPLLSSPHHRLNPGVSWAVHYAASRASLIAD